MFMDILAPINLLFCGQIGKDELAAAGLALSVRSLHISLPTTDTS
jgi:hypothetical protein